jgi:hypothetical protein
MNSCNVTVMNNLKHEAKYAADPKQLICILDRNSISFSNQKSMSLYLPKLIKIIS